MDSIKFQSHCQPFETAYESEADYPVCIPSRDCLSFYFFASLFDSFIVYWNLCLSYGETWKWKKTGNKLLYWIPCLRDLFSWTEHIIGEGKHDDWNMICIICTFYNLFHDQTETTLYFGIIIIDQVAFNRSCSR